MSVRAPKDPDERNQAPEHDRERRVRQSELCAADAVARAAADLTEIRKGWLLKQKPSHGALLAIAERLHTIGDTLAHEANERPDMARGPSSSTAGPSVRSADQRTETQTALHRLAEQVASTEQILSDYATDLRRRIGTD